MEILKQWNTTKDGNDCIIKLNVCMMYLDERYFVITVKSTSGWFGTETKRYMEMFENITEAEEYYKNECD